MKRTRRIIFRSMTVLSLVLCAATVVMWVRGYTVADSFLRQSFEDIGDRSYWTQDEVRAGKGGVGFNRFVTSASSTTGVFSPKYRMWFKSQISVSGHGAAPFEYPNFHLGFGDTPVWGGFKRGGFSHPEPQHQRPMDSGWQVVVPFWSLFLVTFILPAIWMWNWRSSRFVIGSCLTCGYDLRATPDRCPECGKVPAWAKV